VYRERGAQEVTVTDDMGRKSSGRVGNATPEDAVVEVLRTAGNLNRRLGDALRPHGLTPTQYNVLRILRGARPDGLTCGQVAGRMLDPSPDVTRLLDRLERRGLVVRGRSAGDRRQVVTAITDAGAATLANLDPVVREFNRRQLLAFSGAQVQALLELLTRIGADAA